MNDLFNGFANSATLSNSLSGLDILTRMGIALALAVIAAFNYKFTVRNKGISQEVFYGGMMLTLIVAMILMALDSSLMQALGLFAALSIIRFRTPIKDVRDIVQIFFCIAIGVACGAGAIKVAVYSSILILACQYLLFYFRFDAIPNEYIFKITLSSNGDEGGKSEKEKIDSLLQENAKRFHLSELRNINSQEMELVYEYRPLPSKDMTDLVARLRQFKSIQRVFLLTPGHRL